MDFTEYLNSIERRMSGSRFRVSRDVTLADGSTAPLTARATRFSWKGLVLLSQHVVVVRAEAPTPQDVRSLLDLAFHHAKKVNNVPLFRGLQFGYMVVPCIVSSGLSGELIDTVTAQPRKRWSLFEFPVAHDLSSGATHYFTGRSVWGAFYFSDLRSLASTYLETNN